MNSRVGSNLIGELEARTLRPARRWPEQAPRAIPKDQETPACMRAHTRTLEHASSTPADADSSYSRLGGDKMVSVIWDGCGGPEQTQTHSSVLSHISQD